MQKLFLAPTLFTALAATVTSHAATAAKKPATAKVILIDNGVARSAIYVQPEIMAADIQPAAGQTFAQTQAETQRRRLRESVKDLSVTLQKISGAPVPIRESAPLASEKAKPILIGRLAEAKYGQVKTKSMYEQGFRAVVTKDGIGLMGQSNESTSYAIYEVLDRLGCRWYLPSDMGEELPHLKTIALPLMDYSGAPGTWYRGIWYASEEFRRRNRMGGFPIAASHALETYVTAEQREQHPDWRAVIGGKPDATRLKWSNPGVQQAVADAIIKRLDTHYEPSISLSPGDGGAFDESDDKAWDAGDFDPVMNSPSITDRYIKFCNIIAEKVTKKYPDVKLGFLAYVQYTQAPIREKLHPNLVPQIAPINYCRAHAMTDNCMSRQQVKKVLEGWAKSSDSISYYNYMFNLAEYSAPYPMMHQMSEELPIIFKNKVKYWQPEGITNNDSILPGQYLAIRKSWNPSEDSKAILDDFFTGFYGEAKKPMLAYWQIFDDAWTNVDEHAGGGFGHWRRFTPEVMKQARTTIDNAMKAATTDAVKRRVAMQEQALQQFELFMQMRWDLNSGKLADLGPQSEKWMATQIQLGDTYEKQYAFDKVGWAPKTAAGAWFEPFYQPAYLDATRIARTFDVISPALRNWKYFVDKDKTGEANGLATPAFDDTKWPSTDVGIDTWARLGIPNYYGPVWYRSQVAVPAVAQGKKVFLWVSSEDGNVKVWVNGQLIPYVDDKGQRLDEFTNGYCNPLSFDITAAVKPGAANQITVRGTRIFINELGTGGLQGPLYLYAER